MFLLSSTRLSRKNVTQIPLRTMRYISLAVKGKTSVLECLNRKIVRVSGNEASSFLQGLITNDMRHLEEGARSMYAMFLNTKGRVLYETIIYGTKDKDTFLVECDDLAIANLEKHLKMFRVRKKILIETIEDLKVWVVFDPEVAANRDCVEAETISKSAFQENIGNGAVLKCLTERSDIIACPDPRLSILGVRILAPSSEDITLQSGEAPQQEINYRQYRYQLGIGEGVTDHPPGNCFPLEANCDYLHGISFHKGCYIGQELTARTHHTGVVRKRLMPLTFESTPTELKLDTPIQLPSGCNKVSLGKLRGIEKNVGLALLRVSEALGGTKLKIADLLAETVKPFWWPQELPKERILADKA